MLDNYDKGLDAIMRYSRSIGSKNIKAICLVLLFKLGIPENTPAFDYLHKVLVCFCRNSVKALRDGLYDSILENMELPFDKQALEKAIRKAIDYAWKNKYRSDWFLFFSRDSNGIMKKPTNTEFVSRLGRVLQLWLFCTQEDT